MPSIGQLQYNTSSAVFYEIVTTLSGVGYASVNEHKQLQTCCNYLISWQLYRLVEVPDCSFTAGLLFMSRKGHLQSGVVRRQGVIAYVARLIRPLSVVASVSDYGIVLWPEEGEKSEMLTILCRMEVIPLLQSFALNDVERRKATIRRYSRS